MFHVLSSHRAASQNANLTVNSYLRFVKYIYKKCLQQVHAYNATLCERIFYRFLCICDIVSLHTLDCRNNIYKVLYRDRATFIDLEKMLKKIVVYFSVIALTFYFQYDRKKIIKVFKHIKNSYYSNCFKQNLF